MQIFESKLAALVAAFADEVTYVRDALRRRDPYEFTEEFFLLGIGLAISEARFGGRGGSSDYKVMTAAWRIAVAAGTIWPPLPLRRLTNEAGIGSRTATAKALSRLIEAGWLEFDERTDGLRGNQYSLRVTEEIGDGDEVSKPAPTNEYMESARDGESHGTGVTADPLADSWLIKDDAFAYKALGSTAARLYIHLIAGHRTRLELVELTGLHRDTVKRNLRRLSDHGLALDEGTHWRALPFSAARLDAIAREYGSAGLREAQARRHEAERRANVLRHLEGIVGGQTDPAEWAIVDEGMLVNLSTGELPDVYGRFWWIDRLRLDRRAAFAFALRRVSRKLRATVSRGLSLRSEVSLRLTSATERQHPQAFRAGRGHAPRSRPSLSARARYGWRGGRRR